MEIRKINIDKIKPATYNPRKNLQPDDPEYKKIKKSIDEFGFIEPLIWNERTGNLVGGHQRLKILKERGDKEVEVSVVDLDENREKILNIALNKIQGEWDYLKLGELLREIDIGEYDLEITGFNKIDIEELAINYNPKFANKNINKKDINNVQEKLCNQFSNKNIKLEVSCPYCGEEFFIDKNGLSNDRI